MPSIIKQSKIAQALWNHVFSMMEIHRMFEVYIKYIQGCDNSLQSNVEEFLIFISKGNVFKPVVQSSPEKLAVLINSMIHEVTLEIYGSILMSFLEIIWKLNQKLMLPEYRTEHIVNLMIKAYYATQTPSLKCLILQKISNIQLETRSIDEINELPVMDDYESLGIYLNQVFSFNIRKSYLKFEKRIKRFRDLNFIQNAITDIKNPLCMDCF
ncbi:hypothetical protein RF11_15734 [Thelohanellus kitauei]|uniref:Uncharacterized protein n=1 Tax=Thelohanellus kitauei TaxID=669202 RepID=A0A0C2IX76_THEKT|nr:hypothetical protein RF11_15734 [Thelohanellus kitauei]